LEILCFNPAEKTSLFPNIDDLRHPRIPFPDGCS
jgi:hypothetical protein